MGPGSGTATVICRPFAFSSNPFVALIETFVVKADGSGIDAAIARKNLAPSSPFPVWQLMKVILLT